MPTAYNFVGAASALLMAADVTFDPASTLYATADAAYTAFCNELGIDPATSLGAFDGDDEAFYFAASGIALNPVRDVIFKAHHMIASEGAIGFFDTDPGSTAKTSVTIANVSRMYQTTTNPALFITYHATGMDGKSYNSKWNKGAGGFCVRVDHSQYNGSSLIYKVAIQVTDRRIKVFIENTSAGAFPVLVNTYAGGGSTTKTVVNQYNIGNIGGNGTRTFIDFAYNTVTYRNAGNTLFKVPLSSIIGVHGTKITWVENKPTGTAIAIKTAVNDSEVTPPDASAFVAVANGGIIEGLPNDTVTAGKCLWIKAELSTSDTRYTPELSNMTLYITDDLSLQQLVIKLTEAGRLKYPHGNITVAYTASSGNLKNIAGTIAVFSFNQQGAPTIGNLALVFNPNGPENIQAALDLTIDVNKVTFIDVKEADENIQAALDLTVAVYDINSNPV